MTARKLHVRCAWISVPAVLASSLLLKPPYFDHYESYVYMFAWFSCIDTQSVGSRCKRKQHPLEFFCALPIVLGVGLEYMLLGCASGFDDTVFIPFENLHFDIVIRSSTI